MEFILFSYLAHLACGEQTQSYSWLLIFLLNFSCITSPEEPLCLFAAIEGAQNDIYRWILSLYLYRDRYMWISISGHYSWYTVSDYRLERENLFNYFHHMPFYSFNKYLSKGYGSQGILLGLRDIVVARDRWGSSSQDSGSVGGRQKINMQICVLWICHCRHSLCLFSCLYFCFPRYFSSLQRNYWQKAKLVLNFGWNWSLILCRSFSACFGDAGPL